MTKRPWTAAETHLLTTLYPDTPTKDIAKQLSRTDRQIYSKASALGIKKSEAYLASPHACRLLRGDNVGVNTRFKPGVKPWNKGKPHPSRGRSAETQFKKGEMTGAAQHNYVPIGSTRITKYGSLERKTTDDPDMYPARRWRPVAHLVWEAANGPIPDKHVVRFKPGAHTTIESEITIDRLECISLAENMRRNTMHRYPKEIVDAIRSRGVLNRRINHVEKHQRSA